MTVRLWKKISASILRITAALALVLGIPAAVYWLWQPGSTEPLPDYPDHAIWLGHGWLGDDSWFVRNHRDPRKFRSSEKIEALFQKLCDNHISTVYPHLCPAQFNGSIAPYDKEQLERFLTAAARYKIRVIPWVGGILEESARPAEEVWRKNFIASIVKLLKDHPQLAGVQINIEPLPDGNVDLRRLLDELHPVMQGKILSVAAYPPPTKWQQNFNVHWRLGYIHMIARSCDQLAVMMYDTSIPLEKFYIQLMTSWTQLLCGLIQSYDCELLLGVPAYEDADTGYHHPRVENLSSALRGISAAKRHKLNGIAIYCEWEMDDAKWRIWREFIR